MSETISKQVLNKLEEMQKDMTDIKIKVTEVETKLNGIPALDEAKHDMIWQKLDQHETEINGFKYWGKWFVGIVLLAIVTSLLNLVIK